MPRHTEPPHLRPGLYDAPVTRARDAALAALDAALQETLPYDPHQAAAAFAHLLHQRAHAALGSLTGAQAIDDQRALTNAILDLIAAHAPKTVTPDEDAVADPARRLIAISEPTPPPVTPQPRSRPNIPLAESDLLGDARRAGVERPPLADMVSGTIAVAEEDSDGEKRVQQKATTAGDGSSEEGWHYAGRPGLGAPEGHGGGGVLRRHTA